MGSSDDYEPMVSKIAQLQGNHILYFCFAIRNCDKSIKEQAKTEVYATNGCAWTQTSRDLATLSIPEASSL